MNETLRKALADAGEVDVDSPNAVISEAVLAFVSVPAERCNCDNGIIWLGEEKVLEEVKAAEGTGAVVSFTFGFGGRERTWRACKKCKAGFREAAR